MHPTYLVRSWFYKLIFKFFVFTLYSQEKIKQTGYQSASQSPLQGRREIGAAIERRTWEILLKNTRVLSCLGCSIQSTSDVRLQSCDADIDRVGVRPGDDRYLSSNNGWRRQWMLSSNDSSSSNTSAARIRPHAFFHRVTCMHVYQLGASSLRRWKTRSSSGVFFWAQNDAAVNER